MILIKWDESFFVNIDEINRQYEKLVGIVNTLAGSMPEGQGKTILGKIIDELVNYTKVHFRTEERILKLVDYPEWKSIKLSMLTSSKRLPIFRKGMTRGSLG